MTRHVARNLTALAVLAAPLRRLFPEAPRR